MVTPWKSEQTNGDGVGGEWVTVTHAGSSEGYVAEPLQHCSTHAAPSTRKTAHKVRGACQKRQKGKKRGKKTRANKKRNIFLRTWASATTLPTVATCTYPPNKYIYIKIYIH